MKKVLIGILVLIMVFAMVGCGNSAEEYIGEWDAYKIETDSESVVFSDYYNVVILQLTAEFKNDGTYVFHYYVNGEEGEKYPQMGTYTIENGKIKLSDDGYGEINKDELILYFDNGQVKQYFFKNEMEK